MISEYRVRVLSKGRIIIPKDVRKKYSIAPGTILNLSPCGDNRLILEKVPKLSELFGILGNVKTSDILHEERDEEVRSERERSKVRRRKKSHPL